MTDIEEVIQQLKNFGSGAHAHTANKCAYYLEIVNAKGFDPDKISLGGIVLKKQEWVDRLITQARKAMNTGEWKELTMLMRSWW